MENIPVASGQEAENSLAFCLFQEQPLSHGATYSGLNQFPKAGSTSRPPAGLLLAVGARYEVRRVPVFCTLPFSSLLRTVVSPRLLDLSSSPCKVTSHHSLSFCFAQARLPLRGRALLPPPGPPTPPPPRQADFQF